MTDHMTAAERMAPHANTLEAKRAQSVAYLRLQKKYLLDLDCTFCPTKAAKTDVGATIDAAMANTINDECHIAAEELNGLWFLRRQAV